jgi:two-component system cell cycle response regulator DivK
MGALAETARALNGLVMEWRSIPERKEMKSQAILIVDDNESNLRLMEAILDAEGYPVKSAMDAEEALALLQTWQPALILMDIQLPGIDGLELTRRLKNDPRFSRIVIVALTAYAMKGDEDKALSAGCDGYVTKPIDTRSLPAMIQRYLKGPTGNGSARGARAARKRRTSKPAPLA